MKEWRSESFPTTKFGGRCCITCLCCLVHCCLVAVLSFRINCHQSRELMTGMKWVEKGLHLRLLLPFTWTTTKQKPTCHHPLEQYAWRQSTKGNNTWINEQLLYRIMCAVSSWRTELTLFCYFSLDSICFVVRFLPQLALTCLMQFLFSP